MKISKIGKKTKLSDLPKEEKAQALVDLWIARHAEWISGGKLDSYLQSLFACGSCEFCIEMREGCPSYDKFKICPDCIFYGPCFNVYTAMRKKLHGEITLPEIETIFNTEQQNMEDIFDANY